MSLRIEKMPFSDMEGVEKLMKMLVAMQNDWNSFTNLASSTYNTAFVGRCKNAAEEMMTIRTDETMRDLGKTVTIIRDNYLKTSAGLWRSFKFYLTKANRNIDINIMNIFGTNNFQYSSRTALRMYAFWHNLQDLYNEQPYIDAFDGTDISASLLNKINTNKQNLKASQNAVFQFSMERQNLTLKRNDRRIELMYCIRTIAEAGKTLFPEGHPKHQHYVINSGTYNPMDNHTIDPNTKQGFYDGLLSDISIVKIKNVGAVPVTMYVAENMDSAAHGSAVVVNPNMDLIVAVSEINVEGVHDVLVVQNMSEGIARIQLQVDI